MSLSNPYEGIPATVLPPDPLCAGFDQIQIDALMNWIDPLRQGQDLIQDSVEDGSDTTYTAGTGININDDDVIGRIPSRVYTVSAEWTADINGVAKDTPTAMTLYHSAGEESAKGVPSPVFGKITGLMVTQNNGGSPTFKYKPYNVTTGSMVGAPEVTGLLSNTAGYDWDDGIAVSPGDDIVLRYEISATGPGTDWAAATFIIEEQSAYVVTGPITPDATGVYVRNGQYAGKPAFERVDGAYWIWWVASPISIWVISAEKGETVDEWDGQGGAAIVSTYNAGGSHTGTATVTAQAD